MAVPAQERDAVLGVKRQEVVSGLSQAKSIFSAYALRNSIKDLGLRTINRLKLSLLDY